MMELHIKDIFSRDGEYIISWDVGNSVDLFETQDIRINYGFEPADVPFFPINITLASLLPPLVERYRSVKIRSPFVFDNLTISYWNTYMHEILHSNKFNISFESMGNIESGINRLHKKETNNIGLFFGGGREYVCTLHHVSQKTNLDFSYWKKLHE